MKLVGMMPVRNEDWCLGLSLRVALMWCDEVVVLLHACTDRSEVIARDTRAENGNERVTIVRALGETWTEMQHRHEMLETARARGATHLAIIDADEVLTGNMVHHPGSRTGDGWLFSKYSSNPAYIRPLIEQMLPWHIAQLPGYNLRQHPIQMSADPQMRALTRYHSNGVWGNRWFSVAFADDPALSWTGDRFHQREPQGKKLTPYQPIQQGQGGVMHLWGASERRLIAKHALYKVTEHLRKMNTVEHIELKYNDYRSPSDNAKHWPQQTEWHKPWTYSPVPESWWATYAHLMKYLDVDAEPWQEAEVRRLVAEHGREKFAGLDLFGVA